MKNGQLRIGSSIRTESVKRGNSGWGPDFDFCRKSNLGHFGPFQTNFVQKIFFEQQDHHYVHSTKLEKTND